MTKEEIGRILQNLRKQAGLTQKQVGEMLGRKQQVIGHWETGYSQPDADTLFELCRIYGVSVNKAFGFPEFDPVLDSFHKQLIEAYDAANEITQQNVCLLLGIQPISAQKTPGKEAQGL